MIGTKYKYCNYEDRVVTVNEIEFTSLKEFEEAKVRIENQSCDEYDYSLVLNK